MRAVVSTSRPTFYNSALASGVVVGPDAVELTRRSSASRRRRRSPVQRHRQRPRRLFDLPAQRILVRLRQPRHARQPGAARGRGDVQSEQRRHLRRRHRDRDLLRQGADVHHRRSRHRPVRGRHQRANSYRGGAAAGQDQPRRPSRSRTKAPATYTWSLRRVRRRAPRRRGPRHARRARRRHLAAENLAGENDSAATPERPSASTPAAPTPSATPDRLRREDGGPSFDFIDMSAQALAGPLTMPHSGSTFRSPSPSIGETYDDVAPAVVQRLPELCRQINPRHNAAIRRLLRRTELSRRSGTTSTPWKGERSTTTGDGFVSSSGTTCRGTRRAGASRHRPGDPVR